MRKTFDVDFAEALGKIRPLHGTNFGPRYHSLDLTDRFRQAGFPSFRLHDCQYVSWDSVDIHSLFPLFHLDENDPANWNFVPTDAYMSALAPLGGEVIYRLGPTIEHQKPKYYIDPPADFDKWARICCNVIRRYNEGWAGGFHHNVRCWEIWNEPWHAPMWAGTPQQFHQLYEVASKTIKKQFPHLHVGGVENNGPFADECLDYFTKHDCPLDFLAINSYQRTPKGIIDSMMIANDKLKAHGFGSTDLRLTEWNWFPETDWEWHEKGEIDRTRIFHDRLGSAENAAFISVVLSYLQDTPVVMANWYAPFIGRWGMFDLHTKPLKPFFAMAAFNQLMATPQRLKADGGDLEQGLSILAGQDGNGHANILLANFGEVRTSQACLSLANLPAGAWQYEELVLDETNDLKPVRPGMRMLTSNKIELALPAACVKLVKLNRL